MATDPVQTPRVRFAPAPTGYLHLGGARTALFNWLYARHHHGKLILRIEDTDEERSTQESTTQVLDALRWLGLNWDEGPYYQSERRKLHLDHANRLREAGLAYPCYMTTEELEARRQAAIKSGKPFRYEGWHRDLTKDQMAQFEAEGRRPALRLRVDPSAEGYTVHDLIKGPTHFPPEQIDDFVLVRSDGLPSFHLANVVDDATMQITHVIRGEDHLTNTIRHQVLFQAIGYPQPQYGHVPMILGPDRSKLSKRHGAVSVMDYAKMGYLPQAMINELALLGWSPADGKEELSRDELIERFDLDRCGRSGSIFDFAKLDHFNKHAIKMMSHEELEDQLRPFMDDALASHEALRSLIELLRDEMVRLTDFAEGANRILSTPVYPPELANDPALREAVTVLHEFAAALMIQLGPLEREAIKTLIKETGKKAGIQGKELFMPIRAALTGTLHGPALDGVIAVLGKKTTLRRMESFLRLAGGSSAP